ncbi:MAG: c-type cytochrome [Sulfurovum sp.]|nr:c-type cytochrome [Sulfurovum sp.]
MKKMVLLSIVAATVLFTGCSEETKKSASETATAAKETTQSAVKDAKEAVTETAEKAVDVSKKVAQDVEEKATEMMEAAKEEAAPAAEAVEEAVAPATEEIEETAAPSDETSEEAAPSATADSEAGKALYAKCAACHGADGRTKALGQSEIIAGQSAADLEIKIAEYKAGTRNVNNMGAMMKAQVATMSDEEIKAVSAYIATF